MIPFSGNPLDRASQRRADPDWIAAQRRDPAARLLPMWRLEPFVIGPEDGPLAAGFLPTGPWEALAAEGATYIFLGLADGAPRFALDISEAANPMAGPLGRLGRFRGLRAAAMLLPKQDIAILGQAKALIDWHQRHGFCPNCGAVTRLADAGYRRICPACAAEHFPRTDPVVIMLPTDADHCLIGRNRRFPPGLYSAFAGFVEPGETIEEAAARELREEVALKIGKVRYFASQPWPFPSSFMIGCYAEAEAREFRIDNEEIEDARWMSRAEMRARLSGAIEDGIKMPAPIAIAYHLIKTWAES